MHKIGGLWKGKSKDGKTYLKGTALGIRILVWPADKKKPSSPDYTISIEFPGEERKEKKQASIVVEDLG